MGWVGTEILFYSTLLSVCENIETKKVYGEHEKKICTLQIIDTIFLLAQFLFLAFLLKI